MTEVSSTDMATQLHAILRRYPLHPFVQQRTTVDRYGFSHLISKSVSRQHTLKCFANWMHGWIWWSPTDTEDFLFDNDPPNIIRIVTKQSFADFLSSNLSCRVVAAGLPYAYHLYEAFGANSIHSRIPNSVLFVPNHSSESNNVSHNFIQYLDYIDSLKSSFDHVSVLIHFLDYSDLAPLVKSRGLLPLVGAAPRCPNSFSRVKALFDSHTYVSTNIIGSHVLYALASDCLVSICGPLDQRSVEPHLADVMRGQYSIGYVERFIYYTSPEYLSSTWLSQFLVDSPFYAPSISESIRAKIRQELGHPCLHPVDSLPQLIGWTLKGQLSGYSRGFYRRVKRLYQTISRDPLCIN